RAPRRHAAGARRRGGRAEGVRGVDESRAEPAARLLRRGQGGGRGRPEEEGRRLLEPARPAYPGCRRRSRRGQGGPASPRLEAVRRLAGVLFALAAAFCMQAAKAEPSDDDLSRLDPDYAAGARAIEAKDWPLAI